MGTLQLCNLVTPSDIPESLKSMFPSTEKRFKAAERLKHMLQSLSDCAESNHSYCRAIVTTKQLLTDRAQTFAIPRSPYWPDYITRFLESRGSSKEEIVGSGRFLVEVQFVRKDYNILYLVPWEKTMLFPKATAPNTPSLAKLSMDGFDLEQFCNYMQKGNCHHCGAMAAPGSKLQACSRCKKGCYCNRNCQVADWPKHKVVCKALKEAEDVAASLKAN